MQLRLSQIGDVSPDLIGKDRMDAPQAMWRPWRYSGHVARLEGRTVSGIKAGRERTGGLWVRSSGELSLLKTKHIKKSGSWLEVCWSFARSHDCRNGEGKSLFPCDANRP